MRFKFLFPLLCMSLGLGCVSPAFAEGTEKSTMKIKPIYGEEKPVVALNYTGLDMSGLDQMNLRFGSSGYGDMNMTGGCSITFAEYRDGTVGAVRNMDLQATPFCSYEMFIRPGENVKYPTWGIAYTGMDTEDYKTILKNDITDERYAAIPFTATDSMSFGKNEKGEDASLYCAILMRTEQLDENGDYTWVCSGTNPGAPIRCCTQSVTTLIATQCLTIDEALKYVGAVDEDYVRIFPEDAPVLDVYTFNIEMGDIHNHWFECCAMEDSTGRHGVLEFIDNYAIWHEGIDYSFNFFLQKDYFLNEDGTYKEQYGAGLGRYEATVPYLDQIHTVSDHVALMDGIRYSYMTYYNEEAGYIGHDWLGNPVDWRSEFVHCDAFSGANKFKNILGFDTTEADRKFPLWSNYLNTETGEIVKVDSLDDYLENRDHLQSIWTLNYVMDEANREEITTFLRWSGAVYCTLTTEQVASTSSGWETYFRVIADPMHGTVTRWFNEDVTTADTISRVTWEDLLNP
ncbi:MAG: hypothetical protein Q4F31_10200 [Eubacteriales bacterium]|nr:hypothetical protein [Eubacteriales bacterium]